MIIVCRRSTPRWNWSKMIWCIRLRRYHSTIVIIIKISLASCLLLHGGIALLSERLYDIVLPFRYQFCSIVNHCRQEHWSSSYSIGSIVQNHSPKSVNRWRYPVLRQSDHQVEIDISSDLWPSDDGGHYIKFVGSPFPLKVSDQILN